MHIIITIIKKKIIIIDVVRDSLSVNEWTGKIITFHSSMLIVHHRAVARQKTKNLYLKKNKKLNKS
jgi:hypothetical protein